MMDVVDPAVLQDGAIAAQATVEQKKGAGSGSGLGDVVEGAAELVTSGAVEFVGGAVVATAEGVGAVASGALEVVGSIFSILDL